MYTLYENLKEEKISLSYLGSFSDEITDKLITLSESYLENFNSLSKIKNKVSFLIAECFQNVVRHGGSKDTDRIKVPGHKDFFQIKAFEDRVILASCNLVENKLVSGLEAKIKQLNALNGEELKKIYTEVLANDNFSDKGGAGLGLIEMARKSGLPLKSSFRKINETHANFFLGLEIVISKEIETSKTDIETIIEFYDKLVKENTLILYKGDFFKDSISSLIEMLQNNLIDKENLSSKNVKSIITLTEVLQNVSKHGKTINGTKEGVFSINESPKGFIIECGNYVDKEAVPTFKTYLTSIKAMEIEDIIKQYKERLVTPEITEQGNCGLGLLEIARNSLKNFSFEFVETKEKEMFFSIKINPA